MVKSSVAAFIEADLWRTIEERVWKVSPLPESPPVLLILRTVIYDPASNHDLYESLVSLQNLSIVQSHTQLIWTWNDVSSVHFRCTGLLNLHVWPGVQKSAIRPNVPNNQGLFLPLFQKMPELSEIFQNDDFFLLLTFEICSKRPLKSWQDRQFVIIVSKNCSGCRFGSKFPHCPTNILHVSSDGAGVQSRTLAIRTLPIIVFWSLRYFRSILTAYPWEFDDPIASVTSP